MRRPATLVVLALSVSAGVVTAQDAPSARFGRLAVPVYLQLGIPDGDFAENVDVAGGVGGGVLVRLTEHVGFRAELQFMVYGSETRRVPLGNGPLGRIDVDVTTTNTIFGGGLGLQAGLPGPTARPYIGGSLGFSNFSTSSSVKGSNSNDEPFASSRNYSDFVFAKHLFGGLYLPIRAGAAVIDLGVRYTWNGREVRYLTEGDIIDDPDGPPIIQPRRTRADLWTVVIGVTLGGKR